MVSLKFHDEFVKERFVELGNIKSSEQIVFMITDKEEGNSEVVFLDKSTAIKLSKEIRKQIALLD